MDAARAIVVGAGIAGLASGASLARAGWRVTVLERSTELRTSGGGLGITPNGMLALDAIGAGERVRDRSVVQREGGVRVPGGRFLARQDLGFVRRRFGEPIRALPRIDLIRSLAETVQEAGGEIAFGVRAQVLGRGGPEPAVVQAGDRGWEADLLVGADGIRSAVRSHLFPGHPGLRDCGATSWRAVVPSAGFTPVAAETWGTGRRLSILPLPAGEVHFSALARVPVGAGRADDALGHLQRLFGGWHDPVPLLLERAAGGALFADRIEEIARPLPAFSVGRTALVGDAAHPMTPNVGSANLALEDAVELACAVTGPGWRAPSAALARYDAARRPRTARLARSSRWMGRVAETEWRVGVAVRNGGVWAGGLLPSAVSARSMDGMVGWRPPAPLPAAGCR